MESIQIEMPVAHFNSVIRYVKLAPYDAVKNLRTLVFQKTKDLGVDRDMTKAVKGVPVGSDQCSQSDILEWLDKVTAADEKAVAQVIALDASLVARTDA